ncbi:McrC family protein [Actinocrispum wychmicini]|uniref:McrC family protein n=1 Tax=Actinocrispum wychmicini TaxID=1213861 RepID=UPI001FB66475|nr:McrC family protein [Actinocrispum wychmicini]
MALDDAVGRALAASDILTATPDLATKGQWLLSAKGKVGAATLRVPGREPITLRIRPKIPIARLLFLLNYRQNPKGWRTEDVLVDEDEELLPVMARLFAWQAEKALQQGLHKDYCPVQETALVVRGRIRNADQVRRHHGRLVPLEVTHDEHTIDVAENWVLQKATDVLLGLTTGVPHDVHQRLLRLRFALRDVTPAGHGHSLPGWLPNRNNARFHKALRLAELVLQGASVENRGGGVAVNGFLFDMPKVFEDFVTIALCEKFAAIAGHCGLQTAIYLDERNAIKMKPDFVRYADDGTPVAVADAKYKAEKPSGFPDADLYQILAYCTALNLPEGHLIYAKGNEPHGSHRVKHAGITIHQHTLELDQTPEDLLKDIQKLANRLVPAI